MSAEPHDDFLKIIWGPRKKLCCIRNSVVSNHDTSREQCISGEQCTLIFQLRMLIIFCHICAKIDFGSMAGQQKLPMIDPHVHGQVHALIMGQVNFGL